jgi:hypothetical protein
MQPLQQVYQSVHKGTVTSSIMVWLTQSKVQNGLPRHEKSFLHLKSGQLDHYWGRYMAKVKTHSKCIVRRERVNVCVRLQSQNCELATTPFGENCLAANKNSPF